jgi:hypothetical protein
MSTAIRGGGRRERDTREGGGKRCKMSQEEELRLDVRALRGAERRRSSPLRLGWCALVKVR